jgi:hypothetical protein
MPIQVYDAIERRVVANGTALIPIAGHPNQVGVTNCVVVPGQQLQTNYSYNLINTVTGQSISAQYLTGPGGGMMIAVFQRN